MRCETCDLLLDAEDNYCRNCGAPVQIAQVPAVREQAHPPALFRSTAAPLATGAAAVAATALLRWALGAAMKGLLADERPRREPPAKSRTLTRRDAASPAAARPPKATVEILWYRRTVRD